MSPLKQKLRRCKRTVRNYFFNFEWWKELNSKRALLDLDEYLKTKLCQP